VRRITCLAVRRGATGLRAKGGSIGVAEVRSIGFALRREIWEKLRVQAAHAGLVPPVEPALASEQRRKNRAELLQCHQERVAHRADPCLKLALRIARCALGQLTRRFFLRDVAQQSLTFLLQRFKPLLSGCPVDRERGLGLWSRKLQVWLFRKRAPHLDSIGCWQLIRNRLTTAGLRAEHLYDIPPS
jgi:hypothetical protein